MTLSGMEALVASRLTFGRSPALDREVAAVGWVDWLDRQLDPGSISDDDVEAMVSGYPTLTVGNLANQELLKAGGVNQVIGEISHATWLRFQHSKRHVLQTLVDFWTNHLNVHLFDENRFRHLVTQWDREVIRPHALGRFADMLVASAKGPAMLVYLDNAASNANSAQGVNENYGRELLELHTLGLRDGQGVYGEEDVVAAAKVLSGFSVENHETRGIAYVYRSDFHHAGPVSLLGGAWSTPGRTGAAGEQDGIELLGFLARHESTASYVAWKLCRRLVSDEPPEELVTSAAAVYRANDTAIAPVVRHIVHSPAFAASAGLKLRRPLDLALAVARTLDTDVAAPLDAGAALALHRNPRGVLAGLAQALFRHHAPDGYADTASEWASADGLLRRWEFAADVARNRLGAGIRTDLLTLASGPLPATAGELIDALAVRLLAGGVDHPPHGFPDVPPGAWYERGLDWARAAGVITGYPDGTFHPKTAVRRSNISMMLWHAAGDPSGSPPHGFPDVPPGAWYERGLDWARAAGVITGYPDGTFHPKTAVRRSNISMMLWHAAGDPSGSPPHGFPDVPPGAWYGPGLDWARATGVISGYPDGRFHPKDNVLRSNIAEMLFRIHGGPDPPLSVEERAALVAFAGGEDAAVDERFLERKAPDLVALLLSLPRFQHR